MNKKADAFMSTIVKIIIILILVFVIAQFIGVNLWTLAKSGLGLTEEIIPINYTKVNNQAKITFNDMIKDIKECKDIDDTNCGCYIDLSGFSETHAIQFETNEIKLLNIKNIRRTGHLYKTLKEGDKLYGKGIQIESSDEIQNLNCYFDDSEGEEGYFDTMFFEKEKSKISIRGFDKTLNTKFQLYKKGINKRICWLAIKDNVRECEKDVSITKTGR
ncbi:MAG: hypothetical protein ISS82_02860 [Nanoarchaeota archaeon]|nr:hypothetical protein [Nanoarchaeota archaeon]